MSQSMHLIGDIPQWTLTDRLRKARTEAALSQQGLADEIGVSRRSITNYEKGTHAPGKPVLLSWALRCGVPYQWLRDGTTTTGPDDPATIDLRRTQGKPSSGCVTGASGQILAFPAQQAAQQAA